MICYTVGSANVGDRYQANILVDSGFCARLADFGLAVIIDESTAGGATDNCGLWGTYRWMAPELLLPEKFGFPGELSKRLPSMSTDIYAVGMTILEVSVRLYRLRYRTNLPGGFNRVSSVQRHCSKCNSYLQGHGRGSAR